MLEVAAEEDMPTARAISMILLLLLMIPPASRLAPAQAVTLSLIHI